VQLKYELRRTITLQSDQGSIGTPNIPPALHQRAFGRDTYPTQCTQLPLTPLHIMHETFRQTPSAILPNSNLLTMQLNVLLPEFRVLKQTQTNKPETHCTTSTPSLSLEDSKL